MPSPNALDLDAAIQFLNQFQHPCLVDDWANDANFHTEKSGKLLINFPFAAKTLIEEISAWYEAQLHQNSQIPKFEFTQSIKTLRPADKRPLNGIKNIIVVSSAKGGVGKSTTAVNLAFALIQQGARVGLLDADIYGPSVPLMVGKKSERPVSLDGKTMEPINVQGLQTNSIGYLVPDENAMVWRGPMASKAFAQLVAETHWQDLDYLIVDMPPGTGDIQLSLAQQFPVTAAIVVTTPQDLALIDAVKGVAMFNKVEIPVLGVVENMSYHICSACGHHEHIFGEGGGERIANEFELNLLAQIPLNMSIRRDIDAGQPSVLASPDGEQANIYRQLALKIASQLYWQGESIADQISMATQA